MIKSVLLVIICVYIFWLCLNFILLIIKNSRALNTFKKLEQLLIKRYDLFEKLPLPEETQKYVQELKSLPAGVKFLNRKLALNYIVTCAVADINPELSDEYKIITAELNNLGEIYNKRAMSLKMATEIFPKSFYARFLRIKTIDFYRTTE